MQIHLLKSKIHRAQVTASSVDYAKLDYWIRIAGFRIRRNFQTLMVRNVIDHREFVNGILIESEIGKEIAYTIFDTTDFEYRLGIHDRLVRDILDYPHMTLIDKFGLGPL